MHKKNESPVVGTQQGTNKTNINNIVTPFDEEINTQITPKLSVTKFSIDDEPIINIEDTSINKRIISNREKQEIDSAIKNSVVFDSNINIADLMPTIIRDHIYNIGAVTNVPEDYITCNALSVLSTALTGKFNITGYSSSHKEELNTGFVLGMGSGQMKSTVKDKMFAPLLNYVEEYNNAHRVQIKNNIDELNILKSQKENFLKTASNPKSTEENATEAKQNADKLTEIIENFDKVIKNLELTTGGNVTPERLPKMLSEADNEALTIIDDEGMFFDMINGKYGNGTHENTIVGLFTGDPQPINRVSSEKIDLKKPKLSYFCATQPEPLKEILSITKYENKGLLPRMLKLFPTPKTRIDLKRPELDSVKQYKYDQLIEVILKCEYQNKTIALSREAKELYNDFYSFVTVINQKRFKHIEAFALRLHSHVLKLAGILHLTEKITHAKHAPIDELVSKEVMERAILFGRFFLEQELKIKADVANETLDIKRAKVLLNKLVGIGEIKEYKTLELKGLIRIKDLEIDNKTNVADLKPTFDILVSQGYLKEIPGARGSIKYTTTSFMFN